MSPEESPLGVISGGNDWVPPAEPSAGLSTVIQTWRARRRLLNQARRSGSTVVELPGRSTGLGWRNKMRARHTGGAIVVDGPWPWSDLCRTAGLDSVPDPRVGSGGGLWARGTASGRPALLRVGGGAVGPRAAGDMLRELAGHPLVPHLLAAGNWQELEWTLEQEMPGSMPGTLTAGLVGECVEWLVSLPAGRGTWDIPVIPAGPAAAHLPPGLQGRIDAAGRQAARLSPVLVHGDFWRGNLLAIDGRLSAVIDWDAAALSGPPGLDLLHLLGVEERHRTRASMGRAWVTRFWDRPAVVTWLARLDARLAEGPTRLAVATVWWARSVVSDVSRQPHLAADSRWWDENVALVAEELARGA